SLIVDFLLVVRGDREPEAYARLVNTIGWSDVDDQDKMHSKLQSFLDDARRNHGNHVTLARSSIRPLVDGLLTMIGPQRLASLAAEYEQGDYLQKKIDETLNRIDELWAQGSDVMNALGRFSEDSAIRIMTIHKSKGLEFDSVIVLGVEEETFFGKLVDERAAFFVAISRAKRRLRLTWVKKRPVPTGRPYR